MAGSGVQFITRHVADESVACVCTAKNRWRRRQNDVHANPTEKRRVGNATQQSAYNTLRNAPDKADYLTLSTDQTDRHVTRYSQVCSTRYCWDVLQEHTKEVTLLLNAANSPDCHVVVLLARRRNRLSGR